MKAPPRRHQGVLLRATRPAVAPRAPRCGVVPSQGPSRERAASSAHREAVCFWCMSAHRVRTAVGRVGLASLASVLGLAGQPHSRCSRPGPRGPGRGPGCAAGNGSFGQFPVLSRRALPGPPRPALGCWVSQAGAVVAVTTATTCASGPNQRWRALSAFATASATPPRGDVPQQARRRRRAKSAVVRGRTLPRRHPRRGSFWAAGMCSALAAGVVGRPRPNRPASWHGSPASPEGRRPRPKPRHNNEY